jgi:hypothetical protein
MRLTLRNLGRLSEAKIDLDKDLIVLTGPNNTSKTYVAHTIYALSLHVIPELVLALVDIFQRGSPAIQTSASGLLQINVDRVVDTHLSELLEKVSTAFRSNLADALATSKEFIARTEVTLAINDEQLGEAKQALYSKEKTEWTQRLSSGYTYVVRRVAGDPVWSFEWLPVAQDGGVVSEVGSEHQNQRLLLSFAGITIAGALGRHIIKGYPHSHILTAERAAIQLFSRELSLNRSDLVDDLLEKSTNTSRESDAVLVATLRHRARRYPLAIRHNLEFANKLGERKKDLSPLAPLADILERDVLGGATHVDPDGDVTFHPTPSGPSLSLHLASSSVKSLAGLSFLLRYALKRGELLIIDEPELNLHPDNQRRVSRILARLARAGVKVVISTHSDYIIRELNNLLMLSADRSGELRKRHGYDEEETIAPSCVGAYLFSASNVAPIEVTATGIEVATIDREINSLNTVSQDIYFSLFGKTSS